MRYRVLFHRNSRAERFTPVILFFEEGGAVWSFRCTKRSHREHRGTLLEAVETALAEELGLPQSGDLRFGPIQEAESTADSYELLRSAKLSRRPHSESARRSPSSAAARISSAKFS